MQGWGERDELQIREIASRGDAARSRPGVGGSGNRTALWIVKGKEREGDRPRSGRDERWREGNEKTKWKGNRSRICVEIVGGVVSGFS